MQDGALRTVEADADGIKQRVCGGQRLGLIQPLLDFGDAFFAAECFVAQITTGYRQFFVKAMMIAASDDQPRDDDHGRAVDQCVRHRTHGDAVQLLHVVLSPDFCTQQAQAHLYQSVVQVNQHHVVTPGGDSVIEGDGPNLQRVGVAQAFEAARPRARQRGHLEYGSCWGISQGKRLKRRTAWQNKTRLDRYQDVLWREVEILLRGQQPFVQFCDAVFQFALGAHETSGFGDLGFSEACVEVFERAFDQPRHLRCDDRVDATHVRTHGFEFAQRPDDVVAVTANGCFALFSAIDGVPDQDLFLALTVPVDTTVTLLHHIGVVRDLQMDEAVTVVLQVDTFRRGIGGQQDAHR